MPREGAVEPTSASGRCRVGPLHGFVLGWGRAGVRQELPRIDLNADCGEGFDDAGLMKYVTSANIACGGHTGTSASMARAVALAVDAGVTVGAHPSFMDRDGFGRWPGGLSSRSRALHLMPVLLLGVFTTPAHATSSQYPYNAHYTHTLPGYYTHTRVTHTIAKYK